jgi:hypothetical protein
MLAGCRLDAAACARETFAKGGACSAVDAHERSDVHASDFPEFIAAHSDAPPAEVQSDPDRLERWLTDRNDRAVRDNASFRFFEARGCGRTTLYRCATPSVSNAVWTCIESAYPEGVTKQ